MEGMDWTQALIVLAPNNLCVCWGDEPRLQGILGQILSSRHTLTHSTCPFFTHIFPQGDPGINAGCSE